jgi:hypothetical protein
MAAERDLGCEQLAIASKRNPVDLHGLVAYPPRLRWLWSPGKSEFFEELPVCYPNAIPRVADH